MRFVGGTKGFWPRMLGVLLAGPIAVASPSVSAQSATERADARAIAEQALGAFNDGRFEEALSLFQRAEALVHSPVHQIFVARCQGKLGFLVESRETYLAVTRESVGAGSPRAFRKAQRDAIVELAAVEERLPYVTIEVARARDKPFLVVLNGKRLPSEVVGVRRPINPGEYRAQALAPGRKSIVKKLLVVEGASHEIRLTLRKLNEGEADAYGAVADEPVDEGPSRGARGEPRAGDGEVAEDDDDVEAYLALGVGAVGVIAGSLFALKSSSKRGQADDLCGDDGVCPDEARPRIDALDDEADANRNLAIGSFVVGGAGIAVGVILLAASGSDEKPRSKRKSSTSRGPLVLAPFVGVGSAGVRGTF